MSNDLKSCPFCGGEAELYVEAVIDNNGDIFDNRYWVQCIWCHSKSGRRYMKDSAIALWNRKLTNNSPD